MPSSRGRVVIAGGPDLDVADDVFAHGVQRGHRRGRIDDAVDVVDDRCRCQSCRSGSLSLVPMSRALVSRRGWLSSHCQGWLPSGGTHHEDAAAWGID